MRRFTITQGVHGWQVFDTDINAPIGEVFVDPFRAAVEAEYYERVYGDTYEEDLINRQMNDLDKWEANEARMWD